jgi:hypothetical protein
MANRLLHSKRRKKKAFVTPPMLLRLFAPLLGPHRNAAKELKSGKMEGT